MCCPGGDWPAAPPASFARSPRAPCLGGVFFDPSDAARVFRGVERGPEPDAAAEADGARAAAAAVRAGDAAAAALALLGAAARRREGRVVAGAAALLTGGGASARSLRRGAAALADAARRVGALADRDARNRRRTAHEHCGAAAARGLGFRAAGVDAHDWGHHAPAAEDGDHWLFGGLAVTRSEVARGAGGARPGRSSRPGTAASRQGHAKHDDGPPSRGELRAWVDALDGDFRRWRGDALAYVGRGGGALACRDADVAAFLAPGLRADLHRLSAGGENVGESAERAAWGRLRALARRGAEETVDAADDAPAPLFLDGGEAAFARPSRRRGRPRAAAFVAAAAAARDEAADAALPGLGGLALPAAAAAYLARPAATVAATLPAPPGLRFDDADGRVVVAEVDPAGAAAADGRVRAGDVVVAVDGAAVPDAETCASLLDGKASAALTLRRFVDDGDGDDDAAARNARVALSARLGAAKG